jgi:hypothetical protein
MERSRKSPLVRKHAVGTICFERSLIRVLSSISHPDPPTTGPLKATPQVGTAADRVKVRVVSVDAGRGPIGLRMKTA